MAKGGKEKWIIRESVCDLVWAFWILARMGNTGCLIGHFYGLVFGSGKDFRLRLIPPTTFFLLICIFDHRIIILEESRWGRWSILYGVIVTSLQLITITHASSLRCIIA